MRSKQDAVRPRPRTENVNSSPLSDPQFRALYTFSHALLHYLRWSDRHVAEAGLTEKQYLLLLAVRAREPAPSPCVGDLAADLVIARNSAAELIDRASELGLVRRTRDSRDQRVVRVSLTRTGAAAVERLSRAHLAELERLAMSLHITPRMLEGLSVDFGRLLAT